MSVHSFFKKLFVKSDYSQDGDELSTPYKARTARVFISYSVKDKELAGKVKDGLEIFGMDVFLAHEDLKPSVEWEKAILDSLERADIFIPLITAHYKESDWTDQECGIAFAKNKLIVPIAVQGTLPYGFLSGIQAWKLKHPDLLVLGCDEIIEAIVKTKLGFANEYILDSLITAFRNSCRFDDAGKRAELLLRFPVISKAQAREIIGAAIRNNQIYASSSANRHLKEIIKRHKRLIPKELLVKLDAKIKEGFP